MQIFNKSKPICTATSTMGVKHLVKLQQRDQRQNLHQRYDFGTYFILHPFLPSPSSHHLHCLRKLNLYGRCTALRQCDSCATAVLIQRDFEGSKTTLPIP
ncbi:hypothetical protein O0L34_g8896 [Tuta absoluta]|nr:hypothetical protein O0L34_g8896 [Tuta absoluta]